MVNQSVMYFGRFFPTGGQMMKSLLLQRLLYSSAASQEITTPKLVSLKSSELQGSTKAQLIDKQE
jgi:hypothetical protein